MSLRKYSSFNLFMVKVCTESSISSVIIALSRYNKKNMTYFKLYPYLLKGIVIFQFNLLIKWNHFKCNVSLMISILCCKIIMITWQVTFQYRCQSYWKRHFFYWIKPFIWKMMLSNIKWESFDKDNCYKNISTS